MYLLRNTYCHYTSYYICIGYTEKLQNTIRKPNLKQKYEYEHLKDHRKRWKETEMCHRATSEKIRFVMADRGKRQFAWINNERFARNLEESQSLESFCIFESINDIWLRIEAKREKGIICDLLKFIFWSSAIRLLFIIPCFCTEITWRTQTRRIMQFGAIQINRDTQRGVKVVDKVSQRLFCFLKQCY